MSWGQRARCKPGNRDGNEKVIVDALRARGFHVDRIDGIGVPDLLVAKDGAMWLVEVKQPKGKFKPAQIKWRERWNGPEPITVRTVDEALSFPARVQSVDTGTAERLRGKENV